MTQSFQIPNCAWKRPIGQGWEKPYTVRYASNLDDGAWHGAPLGGFGAGCIGRSSKGDFNLWHIDGGEHVFESMPACQFSVFEQVGEQSQSRVGLEDRCRSFESVPGACLPLLFC